MNKLVIIAALAATAGTAYAGKHMSNVRRDAKQKAAFFAAVMEMKSGDQVSIDFGKRTWFDRL